VSSARAPDVGAACRNTQPTSGAYAAILGWPAAADALEMFSGQESRLVSNAPCATDGSSPYGSVSLSGTSLAAAGVAWVLGSADTAIVDAGAVYLKDGHGAVIKLLKRAARIAGRSGRTSRNDQVCNLALARAKQCSGARRSVPRLVRQPPSCPT
jgi:hypothetical protein